MRARCESRASGPPAASLAILKVGSSPAMVFAALSLIPPLPLSRMLYARPASSRRPPPLPKDVLSGDLSTAPREVDLLIVGAGLSGAVLAERCSSEPA